MKRLPFFLLFALFLSSCNVESQTRQPETDKIKLVFYEDLKESEIVESQIVRANLLNPSGFMEALESHKEAVISKKSLVAIYDEVIVFEVGGGELSYIDTDKIDEKSLAEILEEFPVVEHSH